MGVHGTGLRGSFLVNLGQETRAWRGASAANARCWHSAATIHPTVVMHLRLRIAPPFTHHLIMDWQCAVGDCFVRLRIITLYRLLPSPTPRDFIVTITSSSQHDRRHDGGPRGALHQRHR